MKMRAFCASELEFYLFDESYESAAAKRFHGLKTAGTYIEDYHILQTTKEEGVMRAIRKGLQAAGIPVENSKGEWGPGQEEINVTLCRCAGDGGPACHPEERHQGDRVPAGQVRHLHVEVALRPGRLLLARASVAVGREGRQAAVPRRQERVRHVRPDALVRGRAAQVRARHHLAAGALHQFLQALPGRHLRADQDGVEPRQPHGRLPPVRRGRQGHPHRMPHRRRRPEPLSCLLPD